MSYAFLFRSHIMNFNQNKQNYLAELVLFAFMYSILVVNLVIELLPHKFFRKVSLKDKVSIITNIFSKNLVIGLSYFYFSFQNEYPEEKVSLFEFLTYGWITRLLAFCYIIEFITINQ